MTARSLELYIDDIIEAINKIERYTKDMDSFKFKENELVVDAVIRNLEIIGEASTHIPENIREKYSNSFSFICNAFIVYIRTRFCSFYSRMDP